MTITLENWSIIDFGSAYYAPEQLTTHFKGNAYGHPNFEDGEPVITTRIISFNHGIFETFSESQYVLGKVDPEYEKLYPNALLRVIASVKRLNKEAVS
jgi:hypothetical protein